MTTTHKPIPYTLTDKARRVMKTFASTNIGYACTCCALAVNNDDITGCVHYHGTHSTRIARFDADVTVATESEPYDGLQVYECVGCGNATYGPVYAVTTWT